MCPGAPPRRAVGVRPVLHPQELGLAFVELVVADADRVEPDQAPGTRSSARRGRARRGAGVPPIMSPAPTMNVSTLRASRPPPESSYGWRSIRRHRPGTVALPRPSVRDASRSGAGRVRSRWPWKSLNAQRAARLTGLSGWRRAAADATGASRAPSPPARAALLIVSPLDRLLEMQARGASTDVRPVRSIRATDGSWSEAWSANSAFTCTTSYTSGNDRAGSCSPGSGRASASSPRRRTSSAPPPGASASASSARHPRGCRSSPRTRSR